MAIVAAIFGFALPRFASYGSVLSSMSAMTWPQALLVGAAAAVVAAKSEDPLSKDAGGRVTGAVLSRYGGPLSLAMTKAKAGEWSGPFESDAGWHLVTRDP